MLETGDKNVPGTRRQDCLRYVAQAFQPAGSGDFPVARSMSSPTFNHTPIFHGQDFQWRFCETNATFAGRALCDDEVS